MEPTHKKTLKAISLKLRHLLEGWYDTNDTWHSGDLEQRLAAIGVRRDRDPVPIDELPHLTDDDKHARKVVDAFLALQREAGIKPAKAVAEFVRETAYTWANRLLASRCMEARELIDEVILQKEVYGGRSLEHHRLAQRQPKRCAGEDDGLFAVLGKVFAERAATLPLLFNPKAPGVVLKPTAAALKRCVALLSGAESVNGQNPATDELFNSADALGWAYQYWNTEEKARVFEKVRTRKAKIEGSDIIPATQLYTEPYMVKFLVQNSLGATWAGMRPDTRLTEGWEYLVRDADRAQVEKKPVREITFLDPACGSGHFLIEAFDLFYAMYEEEGDLTEPEDICRSILENNLFGIDIDERAVQIAEAALWMKAAEKAFNFAGAPTNLIATNIRLPKGKDHLKAFLKQYPEDEALRPALEVIFEGLEHADELGSLLQIEEPVEKELRHLKAKYNGIRTHGGVQAKLFEPIIIQGKLPLGIESYDDWRKKTVSALRDHFAAEAKSANLAQAFFGQSAGKGLALFDLLARRYDVVAANPPYMGSGNMGHILRNYVENVYASGKRDLYSTFILRCCSLTESYGRVSMVTMQAWMFLQSFKEIRLSNNRGREYGLLEFSAIEVIAQLGPRAFDPDNKLHDGVGVVLFVLQSQNPTERHELAAIRAITPKDPSDKSQFLKSACTKNEFIRIVQKTFKLIPDAPLVFWASQGFLKLLARGITLASSVEIKQGIVTGNNARFIRYHWENCTRPSWKSFAKAGGYRKWGGFSYWCINWPRVIPIISHSSVGRVRDSSFFGREGWTYSLLSNGCLSARYLDKDSVYDNGAIVVFPQSEIFHEVGALLQTRVLSYMLRLLSQSIRFNGYYVERVPVPIEISNRYLKSASMYCQGLKKSILDSDFLERSFQASFLKTSAKNIREIISHTIGKELCSSACILTGEGYLEHLTCELYQLKSSDVNQVIDETGAPAGWHPLLDGYDAMLLQISERESTNNGLSQYLSQHKRERCTSKILAEKKRALKNLFQTYGLSVLEGSADNGNVNCRDDEKLVVARIMFPEEMIIETFSQDLRIHPISVYGLLKEGIEKEGWRCLPEERRIIADRFTVTILCLLGHRWPKQIEANEPIPDWADEDGIIPLTGGTSEQTLIERARKCIAAEFEGGDVASIEREFAEIMGKTLEQWLETEFFKRHVKQFKKRPIAWQIQSEKYTRNKKPALTCLVYYHKLDGDLLPKIGAQYAGPLRQRYETELRGIEAVPIDARSDRYDKRRVELEGLIEELKGFEIVLKQVSAEAFSSKKLETLIANERPDKWHSIDGIKEPPADNEAFLRQERRYLPDINDGVRVNIAPLQKAGLLAANVLSKKDVEKAIADRAEWRSDERRWCRKGKLPKPGWWQETGLDEI